MIHQCYFDESQRGRLFDSPLCRGFGLYSSVNKDIARNCPELANPQNQVLLAEYGAMLHLWRNPELDPDPWIGFTSYRQLDKFNTVFQDRQAINAFLADCDVVGWAAYQFVDGASGRQLTMAEQGEWNHPGITMCIWHLLMQQNEPLPRNYMARTSGGVYCNYWLMSRENFNEYMTWSYPLVRRCLEQPDDFVRSHPRSLAYLVERLFICWCDLKKKRVRNIAQSVTVQCRNRWLLQNGATNDAQGKQEEFIKLPSWNVSLLELCHRHHALPRGIIHVGAHYAEEREAYRRAGAAHVLWIEADPKNMPQLRENISAYPGSRAIQACLSDTDGKVTSFYRTDNRGESSSILPMGTHKEHFTNIHVTEETTLETKTFASLVREQDISVDLYDFLVLDVQGAELLALKGFADHLDRFKGIYLEVNLETLYQGCALLPDIDAFLKERGFSRRETLITDKQYGDALYLRDGVFEAPPEDLNERKDHAVRVLQLRRAYLCQRGGQGLQKMELIPGGGISEGKSREEQAWIVRAAGHDIVLELIGCYGRSVCLRYLNDCLWLGGSLIRGNLPIALLPAILASQKRIPLGYPFDTNMPVELVDRLREQFQLQYFVETGTRQGVTTTAMASRFKEIHTVELEPNTYRKTAAELAKFPNVNCILGDSVQQLPRILNEIDDRVMLWLDAHWSGGDTGKGDIECPVLAELAAVYDHRSDHIVLIDDARLFLSPPPPPHNPRDWPNFGMISEFLARQRPAPCVSIVGDVIVVGPAEIHPIVEAFCQERGL